ncbi:hypothetical protein PWT90_05231 [Aphanocladium album]|nr:hypothetical protein PWT90_05231 [Aphanocladium album]
MDGLSVAASVIAVVDLSVKVITLCSQYSKAVANAPAEISRLNTLVKGLKTTLDGAEALIKSPQGASLSTSHTLRDQLVGCQSTLQELHDRLGAGVTARPKRRLWSRALKWPFSRGEVEATMATIERHHRIIMDGLQVDQTTLLLHIKSGVDRIPAAAGEDATTAKKPHFVVPFSRDPNFVSRPAIQTRIHELFQGDTTRFALIGMGGFGKSQLAIEFAHEVNHSSPERSVFWLHGSSRATFEESYRSLAERLALPRRHDPKINICALVCDWLRREDVAPWLIILDNADDLDVFFGLSDGTAIASYLPKTSNGKVLVTSRNLNVAERLVGNYEAILKVPPMRNDEALLLLQEKLNIGHEEIAATDLICCLDFIPLAIYQAAAYINRRCISINEYKNRFQNNSTRMSLLKHDGGDIRRHESVSNSVAITWQVTFDQIRQESPAAANLLSLLSFFQPQNIPEGMLSGYSQDLKNNGLDKGDSQTFEDDMDVLLAYSLVSRSMEPQTYEMHSLVQVCTQAWLSQLECTALWNSLFLQLASEQFPKGHFETWGECQLLLPHFDTILKNQPEAEADVLNWGILLKNVSYYMLLMGDFNKAEALCWKSVEVRKSLLGLGNPDTLNSIADLASIYRRQGRWREAEKLGVQALEASMTNLGPDHPDTLASMASLAATYGNQDRWDDAEKLEVQVMEIKKTKLGEDNPSTLASMANLVKTYVCQGRWSEAEMLEVQIIEARKMKLGADHLDTLVSMSNLVSIYIHQGHCDKAEKLQLQTLETLRTKMGEGHPDTLAGMNNLATTYLMQGRWDEAVTLEVQVLETLRAMLGADHPDTLQSMSNLASTYMTHHRWGAAEALARQVLEARRAKLGADHPETLGTMHILAYILAETERLQEAVELMHCCASRREHVLGPQHPDSRSSRNALGLWQLKIFYSDILSRI